MGVPPNHPAIVLPIPPNSAEFRPGAPSGKMVYIILAGASSFRKSGFSGASTGSYMDEL